MNCKYLIKFNYLISCKRMEGFQNILIDDDCYMEPICKYYEERKEINNYCCNQMKESLEMDYIGIINDFYTFPLFGSKCANIKYCPFCGKELKNEL